MLNRRVLTIVVPALAIAITTHSFAQDRVAAVPTAVTRTGATQGTFTTIDDMPWRPLNPKQPGLQMFVVWGNPNEGASEIVQKFPAGWDSGWHWHTAGYEGVVVQGKWTHTFKGAGPETGGPGTTYSQPARQVHDDRCEDGGECIIVAYFHGTRDFIPVSMKAQDSGTGATPATDAKAETTQGTLTTSDAIPWMPVDPKHPGLQMFVVVGDPNEGPAEILQKFPAGMDSGWHWHSAAYQGVVVQGKFTHTFQGAAPETGGPGSVWSQPAGQVHDDKCEEGGDCIVLVYFQGKLDFIPVPIKAQ